MLNRSTKMGEDTFEWKNYLIKNNFLAAPVSCFKHVAMSRSWESITVGVLVEVRSPDCTTCCPTTPCCYWIAVVVKISGYLGLLRYEGFESDSSQDFWLNLCADGNIHPIGWCAENGMPLVPPKCIEDKHTDWKDYLVKRISRTRTIPADFAFKVEELKHTTLKKGMKLEAVDKKLISAVRPAIVTEVIGGRLHLKYDDSESDEEGFWCHERSPLIHPIGWAQIVGHPLKAKPEYAAQSLKKTLFRTFDAKDATWDLFLPVSSSIKNMKFKEGMKLEAVDLWNRSNICVATVTEVLRDNYIMIGIDSMTPANESESFCCHASSPYIFPAGFCESNSIDLTPPKGYKGEFKWQDYLKKTKAKPAPYVLFQREIPNHGFLEGMYLEAVDLMDPRLICIASVSKVIGGLLRIHFEGWDVTYDQWCDCESPDLFPVGWCEVLGYRLEPPRSEGKEDSKKGRKTVPLKMKKVVGRRRISQRKKNDEMLSGITIKKEPDDDLYSGTARMSVEDSSSGSP